VYTEAKHPDPSHQLLGSILDQLACPACSASLALEETGLTCTGCGRVYPIVDGIPVLIAGGEEDDQR
jgi:uncharacterized protein YbaR (Trm112 family)